MQAGDRLPEAQPCRKGPGGLGYNGLSMREQCALAAKKTKSNLDCIN